MSNFPSAPLINFHLEDAGRTQNDLIKIIILVEIQSADHTESIAQGRGKKAGSGGGSHQGEMRKGDFNRTSSDSLSHDDVHLKILHRRV